MERDLRSIGGRDHARADAVGKTVICDRDPDPLELAAPRQRIVEEDELRVHVAVGLALVAERRQIPASRLDFETTRQLLGGVCPAVVWIGDHVARQQLVGPTATNNQTDNNASHAMDYIGLAAPSSHSLIGTT
jgi:hypothetical protein